MSRLTIRGTLHNWVEVHLRTSSYVTGQFYADHRVTGIIQSKFDMGDSWLIRTAGNSLYILLKSEERGRVM